MLRRVASRVSLRSRERKLELFLLELPSPARSRPSSTSASRTRRSAAARPTTSSRRSTRGPSGSPAVGHTELDRFAAAFPAGARRPRRRPVAALRGRRVRPRLLERGRRARRRRARRPAAVRARALPRLEARLRHDAEPLVPARGAHAAAVRALAAGGRRASGWCRSTTCSIRSARRSSQRSFLTACVYSIAA